MPVTGWDHVSLPAGDPAALMDFYKRLTVHRDQPGRRTLKIVGIAATAALIMDVYTW